MQLSMNNGITIELDETIGLPTLIRFGKGSVHFRAKVQMPSLSLLLAAPATIAENSYYNAYKTIRSPLQGGTIRESVRTQLVGGEQIEITVEFKDFILIHRYQVTFDNDLVSYTHPILINKGEQPAHILGISLILPVARVEDEQGQNVTVVHESRYHESVDVFKGEGLHLLGFALGTEEYALLQPIVPETKQSIVVDFLPGGFLAPGGRWEIGCELTLILAPTEEGPAHQHIQDIFLDRGMASAAGNDSWLSYGTIYETFIGLWPASEDGHTYSPYSTMAELIGDLPRLRDGGYDTVYLMPTHPFPGYSVLDYQNLDDEYGDSEPGSMKALCQAAHALGMRVIVDMIMHGVLDREALDRFKVILDAVYPTGEPDLYIYFALHMPYWDTQVPEVHPFYLEHPEWFSHDHEGNPLFSYTRAFDLGHPGFQRFFIDAHLAMIRDYDIDGFRIDAPNWNLFLHGWTRDGIARPSYSSLAADTILRRLYREASIIKPDVGFFVETILPEYQGSGHIVYAYDHHFALKDLAHGKLSGREAANIFQELALLRLPGVKTTYFTDGHDTYWQDFAGRHWWHERHPLPLVKAAMAIVCLSEGAVMHFDGRNPEVQAWMKTLLNLRREHRVLRSGSGAFIPQAVDHEQVFAIRRVSDHAEAFIVISFADAPITFTLDVRADRMSGAWSPWTPLMNQATDLKTQEDHLTLSLLPYGVEVFMRRRANTAS
ncbi:MAG: hypothetical protein GYB68_03935 [Chloroflexi bacterium]|nr:hypothetical protein [Chloroflexota bacterium]